MKVLFKNILILGDGLELKPNELCRDPVHQCSSIRLRVQCSQPDLELLTTYLERSMNT